MKVEPFYRICPSCGNTLNMQVYQVPITPKKTKGKDIVSIILNLLAFYFAFVIYVTMDELVLDCIANFQEVNVFYAIGGFLWQISFSGIAMILSILSRKIKATVFNATNIILSALNIAIIIIEFTMFMSY